MYAQLASPPQRPLWWRLLAAYLKPLWAKAVLLTVLLFGAIGLQLISPQIIRYFIDTTQASGPERALLIAAGLFIGVALLQQVVSIAATYVGEDVGWSATNRLRADLTLHCLRLDMPFHKVRTPGELIERVDGDVTDLASFFSQLVIKVLGNGLLALGILILLFREDWRAGLIGVGYAILLLSLLRAVQNLVVRVWSEGRQAYAELFGFLEERLAGTEDIRANGAADYILVRLYGLMRNLLHRVRRAELVGSFTFVASWSIFVLSRIAALALGATLFLRGEMTIGTVFLIMYYVDYLEGPLNEIRRQVNDLQRAIASIGRIGELFRYQPQIVVEPRAALPSGTLGMRFANVSFGYEDGRWRTEHGGSTIDTRRDETTHATRTTHHAPLSDPNRVLHNVSFALEPGRVLGLLGRTGSGKTTLSRLLFRLYDPTEGTIYLGDSAGMVNMRDVSLDDLRQRVGLVTQDVQLFQATIRDNITFFKHTISDEQILSVIEELGLWPWYASLPAGLDTQIEAGGKSLSAGEAQLLAFTRVFLKDPGLVILDEASSRLDPATEALLERALDRLLRGRTAIIIAHRLHTVQRADEIMILDDGRISEHGPRIQLAGDPTSRFSHLLQTGLEEALV